MSISLKPVNELLGMNFFIPNYQRGYRWEKQQVEDLLNDIDEFVESISGENNTSEIYCLQPLVVKKDEKIETYSVIDGQQRLTTIKILLNCLGEKENYSVTYETRDESHDFLDNINEKCANWQKNADFYHMYHAKKTINEWLEKREKGYKDSFLKTVKERVNFVWYEIDNDVDPIKVFKRLNIGKIGLTESELIKALFLSSNNFTSKATTENKLLTLVEIANEWDKIEYRLQDDRFWLFFHGITYNKPTRIDYILDSTRKTNQDVEKNYDGEMYPTFRFFYDSFKNAEDKQEYLTKQWGRISQIYHIFEEWYNDDELYHYIGFLCALSKTDVVFDYIKAYLGKTKVKIKKRESEKTINTKDDFIRYLKYQIKNKCSEFFNFNLEYEGDNQQKKTVTRPVLLLHNVQTVIDQNASIAEEKKYNLPDFVRFPFHLFKKEDWDVEHIRPNSLEDYEGDRKKTARTKYIYVLKQYHDSFIDQIIKQYDEDLKNEAEETAFNTLWNSINGDKNNELPESQKNKIWNYVLLDASTNREYGNSCFAIKREYVLKKEKGIKPQLSIEHDIVKSSDAKEAAFVPLCTRNVFSKTYTDYPEDLKYWTEKDAAYYRFDMEKTLWWYLLDNPKDFTNEDNRKDAFIKYKENILDKELYNITFKEWYEKEAKTNE